MGKPLADQLSFKILRYVLAVNNLIFLLILNFVTDIGKGGTIEKLFGLFVLAFFILSSLSLLKASTGIMGEDFWFVIAFHVILTGYGLWTGIANVLAMTQQGLPLFGDLTLETISMYGLIPCALLSAWTVVVFFQIRAAKR